MIKVLVPLLLVCFSFAFTPQEERQIIKDIAEIKATLEQLNKRIEDTNKRIEDVNKRIDDLMNFLWMLAGIFSAITAVTIGFALWDRRTMIRPFEDKVKSMEKDILENKEKVQKLIETLRELAKEDEKVARLLKHMNLM
ncbi:hypothetical protein IAE16_01240 [Hydrogenobacter sp. T-2]|uniref:coiled-coil domain-containing protein n=1 Tax=Pampinifervens diazotrophicum TaxID=1632018 RepID=UPI002B25BBFD|nr:hypothetical protein [Hydrogenobacter sp. T-2]WPM32315.1 hypothetical protein IAE16_01240 [Hydrogenobacter sp. T-2]